MKPFATAANAAWLVASIPALTRFAKALKNPEQTQREILLRLLSQNRETVYGREHRFATINGPEDYQRQVPLTDYASLEPLVRRIAGGEANVLTSNPVTRLVPTSGSTGGRKLIPWTPWLQREMNAAIGAWIGDLFLRHPSVMGGKAYWSISPAFQDPENGLGPVPIGFENDSAYLGGIRGRLAEMTFAVPSSIRFVEDGERFRYLTVLALLRVQELRLVSVWHPSFFTLLLDTLEANWVELISDLCRLDRRRSKELSNIEPGDLRTIWPQLKIVSCWCDGQAGLAATELRRRIPWVHVQAKGLLATEGVISIPFRESRPLAVTSHFLEFIDASGTILLSHELQPGRQYEVLLTTGGGLWRCRLGDLIEVDGFIESTPSVKFVGRAGRVSDLCGEKLAEPFVTKVIREACYGSSVAPRFAMLAPERVGDDGWRYTIFVEGDPPASFANRLDEKLRENPHYAWCRDIGQLGPLDCYPVEKEAELVFSSVLMAEGEILGGIKPQSLSLRTDWREHFDQHLARDARINRRDIARNERK